MGIPLTILSWRHSTKAIYRRFVQNKAIVKRFEEEDEEKEDMEDQAYDLQAGHSSRIGNTVYGRLITESTLSTESGQASLRRVSEA
jgi:hypothetical protein